jgi:bifunctional non-homologous end joining protein LigD
MRPRPANEVPDGDHVFDVDWRGIRVLAHVEPDRIRLLTSRGRDLAAQCPQAAGALLAAASAVAPAIIDGLLVEPGPGGRRAAEAGDGRADDGPPAILLAWDVLHLRGRPLLAVPLVQRRSRLLEALPAAPGLLVLRPFEGDGREFHAAARARGMLGVVAKRFDGPYLPGLRSGLWRRIPADPGEARTVGAEVISPRPAIVSLLRLPFDAPG